MIMFLRCDSLAKFVFGSKWRLDPISIFATVLFVNRQMDRPTDGIDVSSIP